MKLRELQCRECDPRCTALFLLLSRLPPSFFQEEESVLGSSLGAATPAYLLSYWLFVFSNLPPGFAPRPLILLATGSRTGLPCRRIDGERPVVLCKCNQIVGDFAAILLSVASLARRVRGIASCTRFTQFPNHETIKNYGNYIPIKWIPARTGQLILTSWGRWFSRIHFHSDSRSSALESHLYELSFYAEKN